MATRTFFLLATLSACAVARNDPDDNGNADADAGVTPMADARPGSTGTDGSTSATCANPFTGVLATWTFAAEAGNQAQTPVTSKATAVTAGPVQRAAGLTPVSGANAINSSGWATAATRDTTKYYTLDLAPAHGCSMTITAASIDAKASATGPTMAVVSTSVDTFAEATALSTSAPSAPTLTMTPQTTGVEVRVYGFGASSGTGTMRLQTTLSITGSIQ